jgi:hypothetical protein
MNRLPQSSRSLLAAGFPRKETDAIGDPEALREGIDIVDA